jgi:hypothetical protein
MQSSPVGSSTVTSVGAPEFVLLLVPKPPAPLLALAVFAAPPPTPVATILWGPVVVESPEPALVVMVATDVVAAELLTADVLVVPEAPPDVTLLEVELVAPPMEVLLVASLVEPGTAPKKSRSLSAPHAAKSKLDSSASPK